MRAAAVRGGLVPDDAAAEKRVSLVTEGEASLHYCIQSGLTAEAMKVCQFLADWFFKELILSASGWQRSNGR